MHEYLWRLLIVLVGWRLTWLVIYCISGLYVGYLSINNGISVNNVNFDRGICISASSVRLRLWGNSRKLVISDLKIGLPSDPSKARSRASSKSKHKSGTRISDSPLSLYPSSRFLKLLVRSILYIARKIDIEFKYTSLDHEKASVHAESISFLLNSRSSSTNPEVYDIGISVSILKASGQLIPSPGKVSPFDLGSLTLSCSFNVDKNNGLVSSVATRLYVDEIELNVFHIIEKVALPSSKSDSMESPKGQPSESKVDPLTNIYKKFSLCFKECSINIAYLCARGIPLMPASPDCTLKQYFDSPTGNTLYTSVDTISIQLERILPSSAGFELLFSSGRDVPINVTCSSSLIKAGFESSSAFTNVKSSCSEKNEFLSVPNLSFTFKTNAVRNLVNGLGFKNSVFEFFSSGNSPMVDLDHHQLAILAYNYNSWRKILTLQKLEKKIKGHKHPVTPGVSDSDEDTGDDTRVETPESTHTQGKNAAPSSQKSLIITRAITLFKENYPQIHIKLTIEQPRIVLRVHNEEAKTVQMLIISYSLMILHVSTIDEKEYDAEWQLIHPNLDYTEKRGVGVAEQVFNEEVCGLTDAKLKIRIFEDLKVKTKIRVNGAFVNLCKPDVLNGLHDIISETHSKVSHNSKSGMINVQSDRKILDIRQAYFDGNLQPHSKTQDDNFSKLFSSLPAWFVLVDFRCDESRLSLGSASPLLPPDYIPELSDSAKQLFADTESTLNLEIASFSLKLEDSEDAAAAYEPSVVSSSHTSSSSETLAEESQMETFWAIIGSIDNFKLSFFNRSKNSSILSIPSLSHRITSMSEHTVKRLAQETSIKAVHVNLDTHKLFAAFGSAYLITQTIVTPLKRLAQRIKKNNQSLMSESAPASETRLIDYLVSSGHIDKMEVTLALSDTFKMRLQNYGLHLDFSHGIISVANRFLRAMVISSTVAHYWDRLVCVDTLTMKVFDPSEQQKIMLRTKSIRITQPNGFVVYKLFDSLAVFVKVAKHLASCFKSEEKVTTVYPSESKPVVSPGIHLHATNVSFNIEDDPFDSELNMIFQLGLVEQRKRQEHLDLFEQQAERDHLPQSDYESGLTSLHQTFEKSWVRKVKIYKEELASEISKNEQFLFGAETQIPDGEYERIKPYSLHAPLLSMILTGLDLTLLKPEFALEEIPDFIHRYGQGVPRDTKYNTMIPSYMDLNVMELRMHLRDYPLPLFYLPFCRGDNGLGRALQMKGHLLMCEALNLDKEHLRELKVQLTDATNKSYLQPNSFDKLIIEKSLSTVKLYTDMSVLFDSESPSRFVWGQSYSFGLQQIMLTVDSFSKPPVDPSPKLGVWDKLKMIIHGSLTIETGEKASIEVAFKGGKDPYDLFGNNNGFILAFKDSVVWKVNEHDDALRFFEVRANKLSWYIPNYLANHLVCWTRESSKTAYYPSKKTFVNSCFGYYLGDHDSDEAADPPNWCEKKVVELSGGISFTVGFLLQRFSEGKENLTSECKPHYEVEPFNPDVTEEGHDSYKGFRSDRLHMAISLKAQTEQSYNTIHLSPGTFKQLFSWWTIFQGNMMLPIRKGKLFQEVQSSQKFSEHLYTNKFLFEIGNLFIGHVFQKEDSDSSSDDYDCVGIRAKVEEFSVDLHQRKEEVIDVHEDLSRHKKVMKMKFNLGQVILNKIDLRTLEARFERDMYAEGKQIHQDPPKNFLKVFDNDKEWFDWRDYHECFFPFTGNVKSAKVLPLLYSETFAYVRDTTKDKGSKEVLEEKMHECILRNTDYQSSEIGLYKRRIKDLSKINSSQVSDQAASYEDRLELLESSMEKCASDRERLTRQDSILSLEREEKENFHNRFLLISMFLKWNEPVRNQLMKYIHFVNLSSIHKKFLSYEFMSFLEDVIEKEANQSDQESLETSPSEQVNRLVKAGRKLQNSQQRFDEFDEIMRQVDGLEKILEDYKIEIISPQIQLHTEELEDSVVIITAPTLESKIVSVVIGKDAQNQSDPKVLEKRYGVVLRDASVMVIDKEDIDANRVAFELKPYGTKTSWPPFLGIETCKNHTFASPDNVLVQQMSLMLTFNQVIASGSSIESMENSTVESVVHESSGSPDSSADKLRVDVPRIAINCTSKQYFTLYATILGLLLYVEPMAAELREKISKLTFSIDFQDFRALRERLASLYGYLSITNELLKNYNFRLQGHLDNEDLNDYLLLTHKKASLETEIVLMQQTIFSGDLVTDSMSRVIQDWRIAADEIVLHMLNDDRSHILDLSIDHGVYRRTVRDDASNDNRVEISTIDGLSRLPDSHFRKFLAPMREHQKDNLITVDWSMNRSIGGIKIIENFDIKSLPLNLRIDEAIGRSLMKFIFRQSDEESIDKSPIISLADRVQTDKSNAEEEDKDQDKDDDKSDTEGDTDAKSGQVSESKRLGNESSLGSSSGPYLDQDVNAMVSRAKKYFSIAKMTSQSFEVMISLHMKSGFKRWLNVTNFLLVLPRWEIESKVLSLLEVVDHFKSVAIKALVSHSGNLLSNKLASRRKNLKRYKKRLELGRTRSFSPTSKSVAEEVSGNIGSTSGSIEETGSQVKASK